MTTRLEACIEALKSTKIPLTTDVNVSQMYMVNRTIDQCIAIVERILSAEPSEEEIRQLAIRLFEERISGTRNVSYPSGYIKIAKAALMTVFGRRG